ncbi:hypothetical protein T12_5897, partial [Trichinella patagoniensis]
MESDEIQFVFTQRNQQKLVYKGRCYTLKRTNRNDKCWICASHVVILLCSIMSLQFCFQFRKREVALASSILTLMPQKSSEP